MPTSNELIFDALVRQQVNLQRLSSGEANKLIRQLTAADKELNGLIASRLVEGQLPDFTTRRWQAMVDEIEKIRSSVISSVGESIGTSMNGAVDFAVENSKAIYDAAVPVEVNFATPPLATLRELARSKPFGGAEMIQTLDEWMGDLEGVDTGRIVGAVRQGLTNGESIPDIQRRVMRATGMTKQNAEAVSRTAVNHASNTGRQEFFNENSEVIQALRVVATLDGRTSPICRARDGQHDAVEIGGDMKDVPKPHVSGSPRRPPFHIRCRTIMIAILDDDTIANLERPFVADSRTRDEREKAFRAQAKGKMSKEEWSNLSREERADKIRDERKQWTKDHVGTTPASTTYDEWLRRQPAEFQNEVLGETKAQAFRNGATMDQYIDRAGNELSIEELRQKIPEHMPPRPPRKPGDLSGPGTPSVKQLRAESKRQETIIKANERKAKREARKAEQKLAVAEREKAAAVRKAEKEAKAAERSEKAAASLEKKKIAAEKIADKEKAQRIAEEAKNAKLEAKKSLEESLLDSDNRIMDSAKRQREAQNQAEKEIPVTFDDKGNIDRGRFDKLQERAHDILSGIAPLGEDPVAYRKWLDSMTDDEKEALKRWGNGVKAKGMRDWQRGRETFSPKLDKKYANLLEGVLERSPKYTQGPVYRGTTMDEKMLRGLEGKLFSEGALASWTYHSGTGMEFALSRVESAARLGRKSVILKVAGKTKWATNVSHLTNVQAYEGEVLMSGKHKFRVVSVRKLPFKDIGEEVWEVVLSEQ